MSMRVLLTDEAQKDVRALPTAMLVRVRAVLVRLADWPEVSGAKPMRHGLKGSFRIRAGDWRVLFHVQGDAVVVTRIANRRDVYED